MRYTDLKLKTSRENPSEEVATNAQLLMRAGYIYKEMAGVYAFLPLGLRVLNNISNIVRKHMDDIGSLEVSLPSMAKSESWAQTGRLDTVDVLYRLEAAHGKEVVFSPTHEEIITPLVQNYVKTYKDFPSCWYQIQTKFRNEARSKSGLMRGREFLMKDAYSFHADKDDFEKYYEQMKEKYREIFEELSIGKITKLVQASGGDFSEFSHEFQTITPVGEDEIFYVKSTEEYWNKEIAPSKSSRTHQKETAQSMREVFGENVIGVEDLCTHLNITPEKTTKTILFETESHRIIAAVINGQYSINELKLKKIIRENFTLASSETVKKITQAEIGYAGIINLPKEVEVFYDDSLEGLMNFEMGANRTNYHNVNVNFGRDIPEPEKFYDFKIAQKGDLYPATGEAYEIHRAAEVGNIFPLGTKFSTAFNFDFTTAEGKGQKPIMGCYGIGISRLMGVLAEIFHDEKGLKWPRNIAPFHCYIIAIGKDQALQRANRLYQVLKAHNIPTLYDNRQDKKIGPGQKFADHELLGIPYRIVVSEKNTKTFELYHRDTEETWEVSEEELLAAV